MHLPEVIIIYEHKVREIQYCYLLKYELEKRGYHVKVCHHSFGKIVLYKLLARPKVVISLCGLTVELQDNWAVINQHRDFLRGRSPYFINLQVEQLFRDEHAAYNVILNDENVEGLYYICWGEHRRRQLLNLGINEDYIVLAGALHLDFLKSPLNKIYLDKHEVGKRYDLNISKPWNLFISSYPYVSYDEKTLKWALGVMNRSGVATSIEELRTLREISIRSQETTLEWIETYLSSADVVFIYRPHPGEKKSEKICNLLKKYPQKFFYISELSIQQWICVSEVINVWVSTAIAEVYAAGKMCNVVQPFMVPNRLKAPIYDICIPISTYEEFIEAQNQTVFNKDKFPISPKALDAYYYSDDIPAYKRVCDLTQRLLERKHWKRVRGKFSFSRIFSRAFIYELYTSIYAKFNVKFSYVLPFRKKDFIRAEKIYDERYREECELNDSEQQIKSIIKEIVFEE